MLNYAERNCFAGEMSRKSRCSLHYLLHSEEIPAYRFVSRKVSRRISMKVFALESVVARSTTIAPRWLRPHFVDANVKGVDLISGEFWLYLLKNCVEKSFIVSSKTRATKYPQNWSKSPNILPTWQISECSRVQTTICLQILVLMNGLCFGGRKMLKIPKPFNVSRQIECLRR